jgi:hypothetical protein
MLQSRRGAPWITISPDSIVLGAANALGGLLQEEEEQIIFV